MIGPDEILNCLNKDGGVPIVANHHRICGSCNKPGANCNTLLCHARAIKRAILVDLFLVNSLSVSQSALICLDSFYFLCVSSGPRPRILAGQ